eukprot:14591741-Ditylum_brightwellii.AAC.1
MEAQYCTDEKVEVGHQSNLFAQFVMLWGVGAMLQGRKQEQAKKAAKFAAFVDSGRRKDRKQGSRNIIGCK